MKTYRRARCPNSTFLYSGGTNSRMVFPAIMLATHALWIDFESFYLLARGGVDSPIIVGHASRSWDHVRFHRFIYPARSSRHAVIDNCESGWITPCGVRARRPDGIE